MDDLITGIGDIKKLIGETPALLLYISTPECNVCRELKPKIIKLLAGNFPKIRFRYIDLDSYKEAAGELSVFSVPTILVFFEGREFYREGRNLGIEQFREQLERPYSMYFE